MIIYQVIPNRAYPYIISSFLGKNLTTNYIGFNKSINYFKYAFEFSEIFDAAELNNLEKMYAYQTEVIRFHPEKNLPRKFSEVFHEKYFKFMTYENKSFKDFENLTFTEMNKEIDLLHGLFTSKKLSNFKQSTDFSFTFIDNPIDSVYNLYQYINYVYTAGFKEFEDNYTNSPYLIPEIDFEGRNYIHYYEILNRKPTLEKFIDSLIDNNMKWIHNFFYFPINIYKEGVGKISELYKDHDFYGIVNTKENLTASIKKLNNFDNFKRLNFSIDINHLSNYFMTNKEIKHTYRREDLKSLLKDDIIFFEEKVKELNAI